MSTPSKALPWCTNLSEEDCKVGRALAGGHLPSVAKAIVGHKQLQELVFACRVHHPLSAQCSPSIFVPKNSSVKLL